jgi:uncharacterized protein YcfJ
METTQAPARIHPLMAGAAASVILVSLLGAAAIAGLIPNSHSNAADAARLAAQTADPAAATPLARMAAPMPAAAPVQQNAPTVKEVVHHKTIVHHQYVQRPAPVRAKPVQVAQSEPVRQYASAPVYQQPAPAAQNSPVGIGVGAVVGGLIGSQIGGGNGKTLATIAGVVGGGYVGNEIAKRN